MGMRVSGIAEIIRRSNLLSKDEFNRALEFSQRDGEPFLYYILKNGKVKEEALMECLRLQIPGIDVINLDEVEIEEGLIQASGITRDIALQYRIIPINRVGNNLLVAVGDPTNIAVWDTIQARIQSKLKFRLASELQIQRALEKYYVNRMDASSASKKGDNVQLSDEARDSYATHFVQNLMVEAARRRASDIHIEPFESRIRVRLRVDGSLIEYDNSPRFEFRDAIIARVKIISQLNISEKRLPQDGNAKIEIPNAGKMDFRISIMPTVWGEKIVMRILDKSNLQLDMTRLGFEEKQLKEFKESIGKPFGMVLVTGPTGSGKTTTLYSALNELNRISDCVVTAEDPVEFTIPGICQMQVRSEIELTFAKALKAFLRQDPDVIMVGEIRDQETAEISMKAAMTGHIVLSTLHTNNAPETLERLRNLNIDPFTIVSAVNAVVAQRLVRKICSQCKIEDVREKEFVLAHGLPEKYWGRVKFYKGEGCGLCNGTGYKGRVAIYEVLTLNDSLKRAIAEGRNVLEIKRLAMSCGMQTLRQSAWKKVSQGVTTVSELLEATSLDDDGRSRPTAPTPSADSGQRS